MGYYQVNKLLSPEKVSKLYPGTKAIHGPYRKKNGRLIVGLYSTSARLRTVSYPKLLLELSIGRRLVGDETCDHIDDNFHNDNISNLQVLSRAANLAKHIPPQETIVLNCTYCGTEFKRLLWRHKINHKSNRHAWFCTKSCKDRYGSLQRRQQRNCPIVAVIKIP